MLRFLFNKIKKSATTDSIAKDIIGAFDGIKSIHSVYVTGSFGTDSQSDKSDVDLSIILQNPEIRDIIILSNRLKTISKKYSKKISSCYSEIGQLKKDLTVLGTHSHGKKRTSFLYDLVNSEKIYGTGLKLEKRDIKYHPLEVYTNFQELTNVFCLHLNQTREDNRKCVNISMIAAKTALLLHGKYETKKPCIISGFQKNIDKEAGKKLELAWKKSKSGKQLTLSELSFLYDFISFCQEKSRIKAKGDKNALRTVKKE